MSKDGNNLADMLVVDTLNRIDSKIDKLDDRLDGQVQILTHQQASLDEHIRRTNILEERIEKEVDFFRQELPNDVKKLVNDHVEEKTKSALKATLKLAATLIGAGGGGVGVGYIIKWLSYFLN